MKLLKSTLFIILLLGCTDNLTKYSKQIVTANNNWGKYFIKNNIEGTFVLKKLNADTLEVYNLDRSEKQYLPASTFKVLNSLISLETKAIENENTIIKWDGRKRFYNKWNQDQNMRSALKYSCVWFYQELARRVGRDTMQYYLNKTQYGNSKLGDKIDTFWLEGDLRISAIEQILFLEKMINKLLPFSGSTVERVKGIMLVDSTETYKYYAKSGWATKVKPQIGWYVGFVIEQNETWLFALNIDVKKKEDTKLRKIIAEEILKSESIL